MFSRIVTVIQTVRGQNLRGLLVINAIQLYKRDTSVILVQLLFSGRNRQVRMWEDWPLKFIHISQNWPYEDTCCTTGRLEIVFMKCSVFRFCTVILGDSIASSSERRLCVLYC